MRESQQARLADGFDKLFRFKMGETVTLAVALGDEAMRPPPKVWIAERRLRQQAGFSLFYVVRIWWPGEGGPYTTELSEGELATLPQEAGGGGSRPRVYQQKRGVS